MAKPGHIVVVVREDVTLGSRKLAKGATVELVDWDAQALVAKRQAHRAPSQESPRPGRDKAHSGPSETKEKGPAPSRLAPFTEQEIIEEIERRTDRPFIEGFSTEVIVKELGARTGGNIFSLFETDQILEELHERGAIEKTDEPFETLTIALPSLAEVQAEPVGKFGAFQADLRAIGVKGRSWDELAEDYERWLEGLLAPLGETEGKGKVEPAPEDKGEDGPPPSPSPAPSEAAPPKEDGNA